jgi:hypothetical protein
MPLKRKLERELLIYWQLDFLVGFTSQPARLAIFKEDALSKPDIPIREFSIINLQFPTLKLFYLAFGGLLFKVLALIRFVAAAAKAQFNLHEMALNIHSKRH